MKQKIHRWLTLVSLLSVFYIIGSIDAGEIGVIKGAVMALAANLSFAANGYMGELMYIKPKGGR